MDSGSAHNGCVQGIASRKSIDGVKECLGSPNLRDTEAQDFVGQRIQACERGVNGIETPYRSVSMKNLLVDLHVGDKPLSVPHQLC